MLYCTLKIKAVGEYNSWLKRDRFYAATIMLDIRTGEVWTDCFTSCNSWIDYKSEFIINLSNIIRRFTEEKITMKLLNEYALKVINKEIIYNI